MVKKEVYRLTLTALAFSAIGFGLQGCSNDEPQETEATYSQVETQLDYGAKPNLKAGIINYGLGPMNFGPEVDFWGEVTPPNAHIPTETDIELSLYMILDGDKENPIYLYEGRGKIEYKRDENGVITSQKVYPVGYEFDPVDFYNKIVENGAKMARLYVMVDPNNKIDESNEDDNVRRLKPFDREEFELFFDGDVNENLLRKLIR